MSRRNSESNPFRILAAGIVIIAVGMGGQAALRAWGFFAPGEFAAYLVLAVGWGVALAGSNGIASVNERCRSARSAAGLGAMCLMLALILALVNDQRGLGDQTFTEFKVMALYFVSVVCFAYIISASMRGAAEAARRRKDKHYADVCESTWKSVIVITFAALVLEPAASVFPRAVEWISVGVCVAIAFVYQARAAALIGNGRAPSKRSGA